MHSFEIAAQQAVTVRSYHEFCIIRRIVIGSGVQVTIRHHLGYASVWTPTINDSKTYSEMHRHIPIAPDSQARPVQRLIAIQLIKRTMPQDERVLIA